MDFTKSVRKQLPSGGKLKTGFSIDGDTIPLSVTYNTRAGEEKTVKMIMSIDGDYIPETGYTLDGDFNFPNQKLDFSL